MEAENARTGKRSPCADGDLSGAKKRRKQLKPVRIAAVDVPDSLPSLMVQVPKDDVVNCSEPAPVPLAKPPRCPLRDVPFQNDIRSDALTTTASNVPIPDSGPSGPSMPAYAAYAALPFSYHQHHHPWTDRAHKIFNQEAYCELCKKEFCNKYFLKTHKANKHGIYSNDTVSANGSASTTPTPALTPTTTTTIANQSEPHAGTEADDKTKAFCDLCNKSFCNKYFVRRHKTKSHGMDDVDDTNSVQMCSTNDARSTLTLQFNEDSKQFSPDNHERGEDQEDEPLNLVVNAESEASSEGKPDECTENLEKLQTMLLRLRPDTDPDGQDEHTDDSGDVEPTNFQPDHELLRKQNSKPTSSYCEICNKELCNKYFMRTHMQRMHGIELEHGAQIGGVVCNICNKELCSKYFLRVHKQNTHGIPGPTGLPSLRPDPKVPSRSPAFTQICLICNKRFRSSKWLQAHLQSDHRDLNESPTDAPVDVISKLLWEGGSGSATFSCSHCSFTTPVLAFLFVHERSHVPGGAIDGTELVKPSLALQELIHHKTFWQHAITQPPTSVGLDLTAPRNPTS